MLRRELFVSHRLSHHVITPLATLQELDAALARSSTSPVLIFKHSSTCGLSAMAAEEVTAWLDTAHIAAEVYVVDVRHSRPVSQAVAERLKVRHESPQVLLVQAGTVTWHRSHSGVTAAAIERALSSAVPKISRAQ